MKLRCKAHLPLAGRSFFLLLTLCTLGWAPSAWAQQTSTLRGRVVDPDGAPVIGVTVLVPSQQTGAYTDEEGIFSIPKLNPGDAELLITYLGYDTIRQTVTLTAGKTTTYNYTMKETITEIAAVEIVGQQFGTINKTEAAPGVTTIEVRDIKALPNLGTPDLAQYLQVLPGVVFTGDQGGQLFIRGGTPVQNLTFMDGAIVYSPFHTLGLFSVFDTDILRSVDVYSGGFSAEYGGRISSVIDIKTRPGNFQRLTGKVHANPITSGALIEGPLYGRTDGGPGSGSFLLSARHCYLDQTSTTLYNYVNDTTGLPFSFTDIYGKLTFGREGTQINLFGFYQRDAVSYAPPTNYRWQSGGGGAEFFILPRNSSVIVSGNIAGSAFSNNQAVPNEAFPRKSTIGGFNSRLNFAYIFNSIDRFDYGIQVLGFATQFQFTNSLGLITAQDDNNTELAAYVKYKKVFTKKVVGLNGYTEKKPLVVLEPSLRAHFYNDKSYFSFEPRLRIKINLPRVSLQLAGGRYSQNLMAATSDRDVVALFQGFLAAPTDVFNAQFDHTLQIADHLLGGVQIEALPGLELQVEGWYKIFRQLTNINRDRYFAADPRFIAETGQAYGVDLVARYKRKNFNLYASYSWAYNRRTLGNQAYFPVFDRRHTANFTANYGVGELREKNSGKFIEAKWEFSLRWTLGSGFPFQQTQGFFEKPSFLGNGSQTDYVNQQGSLGLLLTNELFTGRLPYYHRLDFSAKRRFLIGNRCILELNVNVLNAYNRQNIFYFDRERFERVDQLPIVPTVGVTFQF